MSKYKRLVSIRTYLSVTLCFISFYALADGYLTSSHLKAINHQCYIEEAKIVFCSDGEISNPQVIVKLPLLEPVILSNGVRAYRVMATIDNHTKRNLVGAKIFLTFDREQNHYIDVIISEKIMYKATSSTRRSHLIRSDVPQNSPLYEALNQVYFNADISNIKVKLKELLFEDN